MRQNQYSYLMTVCNSKKEKLLVAIINPDGYKRSKGQSRLNARKKA